MGNAIITIANLSTAGALIATLLVFIVERRRIEIEREERVFQAVNDAYLSYLGHVIDSSSTTAFEVAVTEGSQPLQDYAIWEVLFTTIERAYVLYRADRPGSRESDNFRSRQWQGWNEWCHRWASHAGFVDAWSQLRGSEETDDRFGAYIDGLIRTNQGT